MEPLSRCLDSKSARRVTELQIDPSINKRISTLPERANGGLLTVDERADYEALYCLLPKLTAN